MQLTSPSRRDLFRIALAPAVSSVAAQNTRPNIVLVLADDLGYQDLGMQGSPEIRTPHIDSIARGGVRFTNGYVSHPFCSPTRAGLLTGRYQQRFGHENNMVFNQADPVAGLPLTEVTLADVLSKAGYATGLVGKWHLGAHPKFHPMKRGFREMFGFVGGGHDYFDFGTPGDTREHFIPVERDGHPVKEQTYLTTALGREGAAFVRRHTKDPFFLYLAFNAPHTPLQAPERYRKQYSAIGDENRRTYAAQVTAMDDAIGQVLQAIRESGTENRTLVVFLNDNGGPTGNSSSNKPLRGTKRTLYEGGIRVPFAMRWPERLPQGKVDHRPVISLDVFPTAAAAAGAVVPDRRLDGVNLLPYLDGSAKGLPHEHLFWRTFGGVQYAVRSGQYKLVRDGRTEPELYDLESDIGEETNIASQRPHVIRRLLAAEDKWNRELITPLWDDHIFHRKK